MNLLYFWIDAQFGIIPLEILLAVLPEPATLKEILTIRLERRGLRSRLECFVGMIIYERTRMIECGENLKWFQIKNLKKMLAKFFDIDKLQEDENFEISREYFKICSTFMAKLLWWKYIEKV